MPVPRSITSPRSLLLGAAVNLVAACSSGDTAPEEMGRDAGVGMTGPDSGQMTEELPRVPGYCNAPIEGTGTVPIETEYLAKVVSCENGQASLEALKAQAVSARSYLYYKLDVDGFIGDGQGDQVFSCNNAPNADHFRAVEETSGEVLTHKGTQVAAFYVAGALQTAPSCRGGTADATNTERFVTYNQGLSGDALIQTTLGFVHTENHANRGCMSQNGSACLSDGGWTYRDILPFYYGEDIVLSKGIGDCIIE
ncbi:MAG: hypothetical protein GY811_28940 [Myxococcales bacterium]|nr:hypothetical protein [Myxococcales bacterium]